MKLLLQGIFLALASLTVFPVLPIRRLRLVCLIVKFNRWRLVVISVATVLLMPTAVTMAVTMAMAAGAILSLRCTSVVIVGFVLLIREVLADEGVALVVVVVRHVSATTMMVHLIELSSSV